jgi:cytochrome P450
VYEREVNVLQNKIKRGVEKPCFALDFLYKTEKKEYEMDNAEKLMVLSTLFEAGSDTSRIAVTQMVAAAAVYPDWVRKAQGLLDEVCGSNAERLPNFNDRQSLPYMSAVVKETLRWRPFIQTGVPHMLTQELEYEGYRFPAGTQFTWNAYAIALNEEDYSDAHKFNPDRFMNDDLRSPLKGHWSFGAGMLKPF